MNMPVMIYDDPHMINEIRFADGRRYTAGANASKIIAYKEEGISSYIAFYAVYQYSDELTARVPAHMVEVIYSNLLLEPKP